MTGPDYAALEAALHAQRTARLLPAELVAEVRTSPMLASRLQREQTLDWLRRQSAEDRDGFHVSLRQIRDQWNQEQAMLDQFWQAFGNETDRSLVREWRDAGASLELIAGWLGFVYAADVTPEMITPLLED